MSNATSVKAALAMPSARQNKQMPHIVDEGRKEKSSRSEKVEVIGLSEASGARIPETQHFRRACDLSSRVLRNVQRPDTNIIVSNDPLFTLVPNNVSIS
jgi:hypothetical protein